MLDSIPTDMLDSFRAFTFGVWSTIAVTITLIAAIYSVHLKNNRINNCKTISIFTVIAFTLRNYAIKKINWISKLISLIMTLFTFLIVICYFMNIITTDRIKIEDQFVYKSYRDIIHGVENGADIDIIHTPQSELMSCLNSDPKTDAKIKLRNYIVNRKKGFGLIGDDLIGKLISDKYDYVMIDGMLSTKIAKFIGCKLMPIKNYKETPDTCLHRTEETSDGIQRVNGFMASSAFRTKVIHEKFRTHVMRGFQSGLISRAYSLIYEEMIGNISRMDCLSESKNVVKHSPGFESIHIDMYYNCFICLFVIILIAITILIHEIISGRNKIKINEVDIWIMEPK